MLLGKGCSACQAVACEAAKAGWGGRIRTCECRYQKPVPYHLATPQQALPHMRGKAGAYSRTSRSREGRWRLAFADWSKGGSPRRCARLASLGRFAQTWLIRGTDDEIPLFDCHDSRCCRRPRGRKARRSIRRPASTSARSTARPRPGDDFFQYANGTYLERIDNSRRPPDAVAPARDDRPDGSAAPPAAPASRRATSPSSRPTSRARPALFIIRSWTKPTDRPARRRRHRSRARRDPRRARPPRPRRG